MHKLDKLVRDYTAAADEIQARRIARDKFCKEMGAGFVYMPHGEHKGMCAMCGAGFRTAETFYEKNGRYWHVYCFPVSLAEWMKNSGKYGIVIRADAMKA